MRKRTGKRKATSITLSPPLSSFRKREGERVMFNQPTSTRGTNAMRYNDSPYNLELQRAQWERGRAAARARRAEHNAEAEAEYRARWAAAPVITFVRVA